MVTRTPRDFFKPLALNAPEPLKEIPAAAERMIHFFPPHIEKMRARVPQMIKDVDILLGNLEDAIPVDQKEAARKGLIEVGQNNDFGSTGFWVRVNALDSPWFLDDMIELMAAIGDKLDVIMIPKVAGPWDVHFVDQLLAQLEAKHNIQKPMMIHVILETAEGVKNVSEIAGASPRMQGISLGPADLAASRGMKSTRVGGPHPGYGVYDDEHADGAPRAFHIQDIWHYTVARMVDACQTHGIRAFYGPFGDFSDDVACEAQFQSAFILGCVGAWSLHPKQVEIAKRVFSPDPDEVAFAKKILEALPDGAGAQLVDGKMQDDATWKQAKVMVDSARLLAEKDPELKEKYGF